MQTRRESMQIGWLKRLITGSIGAAVLMVATGAQATLFNLSGNTIPTLSKTVTADGITLTTTGQYRNGTSWFDSLVTQKPGGYGLQGGGNAQLDSRIFNEYLLFSISGLGFGQSLVIDSILFFDFQANEDFSFYVDTDPAQVGGQTLGPGFSPGANPWLLSNDLIDAARTAGVSFALKVNGVNNVEAFRIQEITAHVVPEPASLALLGLGLAGIGYRRHSSKIAA